MRFIESVLCKCFPVGPDFFELIGWMSFCRSPVNKLSFHFIQHRFLLLTHGFSQHVRISFGKTGKALTQQHYLFLVNCDTIGIAQVFLHFFDIVTDGFPAMFTGDEIGDIGNWSRTIQGVHGYQVIKLIRL